MWKCHPTQYKRDRDIRLNKKCAEVMRLYQERFLQQQQQQQHQQQQHIQQQRLQQQVDPTEESWDNDAYPTYTPKKKTYGDQSTAVEVEGHEHQ
jgi:Tfp pilus assembly protein PilV